MASPRSRGAVIAWRTGLVGDAELGGKVTFGGKPSVYWPETIQMASATWVQVRGMVCAWPGVETAMSRCQAEVTQRMGGMTMSQDESGRVSALPRRGLPGWGGLRWLRLMSRPGCGSSWLRPSGPGGRNSACRSVSWLSGPG
jgi:hypothetical protein